MADCTGLGEKENITSETETETETKTKTKTEVLDLVLLRRAEQLAEAREETTLECYALGELRWLTKKKRSQTVWEASSRTEPVLVSGEAGEENPDSLVAVPDEQEPHWALMDAEEEAMLTALPTDLMARLFACGGRGFVKVLEKRLSKTDVEGNNNRLSMPKNQLLALPEEILSLEEISKISRKQDATVVTIDEKEREYSMKLKLWRMNSTKVYNLCTHWNKLVRNNGLEAGALVQVWAFWRAGKPCFAVVKLAN